MGVERSWRGGKKGHGRGKGVWKGRRVGAREGKGGMEGEREGKGVWKRKMVEEMRNANGMKEKAKEEIDRKAFRRAMCNEVTPFPCPNPYK